jgi:hypothetical protein
MSAIEAGVLWIAKAEDREKLYFEDEKAKETCVCEARLRKSHGMHMPGLYDRENFYIYIGNVRSMLQQEHA